MNHTIIKKALNEALTQKYYDELMDCEDEEHIFSVGFTADMKRLIRKTDDKLLYYSKYAAIAACACIAIGCAVLLPNLINSGIRTEPPVTTTPVVESDPETGTTTTEATTLPIIITTAPDETSLDTDSAVTSEVTTTEITTTPTETTTTPATTTEEKVTETEDTADDEQADANGDIIDDDTDADRDSPDSDADIIIDSEGDDCVVLPDEGGDAETDAEEEEEVEIEDEADIDADVEEEDDVTIEEDDINPGAGGDIPPFPEGNTLREIYETHNSGKLEETRVFSVTCYDADFMEKAYLYGGIYDLTFVEEYIFSQADAVRLDNPAEDSITDTTAYPEDYDVPVAGDDITVPDTSGMRSIFVQLSVGKLTHNVSFYDSSRRNNYGEFFRGEFSDDVDVEDEEYTLELRVGIEIYENGMAYYGNSVPMQFDPAATEELFKRFDKIGLPDYASTVSEIIDYTEISSENIIGGVATIRNVYDIGLSGVEINTEEEIAGLYDIIKNLKKSSCVPGSGTGQVEIEFYVSETLSMFRLILCDPYTDKPTLFIMDNRHTYKVDITHKKAQEIISYICKCAGVAEPYFYVTAEEYLNYVGVDFSGVKSIRARGEINGVACTYTVTSPEKIKKLTEMVAGELKNTRYIGSIYSNSWLYADFIMENWTLSLCEGYIKVGPYAASQFEISGDILKKVNEYIAANADETAMEEIEVEDDHAVEEDVAIEEEIDE